MALLEGLGLKTEANEDVLSLAGIDLCGVGVRRPQVYLKGGGGVHDPFITLRHAEWGHTSAFNMVSKPNCVLCDLMITTAGSASVVDR